MMRKVNEAATDDARPSVGVVPDGTIQQRFYGHGIARLKLQLINERSRLCLVSSIDRLNLLRNVALAHDVLHTGHARFEASGHTSAGSSSRNGLHVMRGCGFGEALI